MTLPSPGGVQEGPAQGGHAARQYRQGEVRQSVAGRAVDDVPSVPAEVLPVHTPGGLQLPALLALHPPHLPAPAAGRHGPLLLPPDGPDAPVPAGDVRHGGLPAAAPRHADAPRQAEPLCPAAQSRLQRQRLDKHSELSTTRQCAALLLPPRFLGYLIIE